MPKAIPKSNNGHQPVGGGPRGGRKRKLEPDSPSTRPGPVQAARPRECVPVAARMIQERPTPTTTATRRISIGGGAPGQRTASPPNSSSTVSSTTRSPSESPADRAGASNFLLEALRRIRELQDELDFLQNDPYAEDTDDEDEDEHDDDDADGGPMGQRTIGGQQAEAIGWAVCARETMHYLQREGVPADSPLMVNLRRRLVGTHEGPNVPDEGLSC